MARLANVRKLTVEDFNGQAWAEKLIVPFNSFIDSVQAVLNKGLTIGDNMAAVIRIAEVNGTYPVKLAWPLSSKPVSVLVGDIYRTDGTAVVLTAAVGIQWSFNQSGELQLDNVVGLPVAATDTVKYKLVLEAKVG